MPKLVCRSCGQGVYTTAPFEQLFADERRCPRCGQLLFSDRRSGVTRRKAQRRRPADVEALSTTEPHTNGGPINSSPGNGAAAPDRAAATGQGSDAATATLVGAEAERRQGDRRQTRRRREDNNPFQRASEEAGWAG